MPIQSVTVEGVPEGSNLASPAHEISDTQVRYLQDGFLDVIGEVYRRGPLLPASSVVSFGTKLSGIVRAYDPNSTNRIAVLRDNGGGGSYFSTLADGYATAVDLAWNGALPSAPYAVVDSKPALAGGSFVGTGAQYGSGTRSLGLWRGANKANYTTGTITVTRASKTVAGSGTSWSGNAVPGMFLFGTADDPAATVYFGVVKSVDSNTQITLEDPSPFAATAKAYTLQSIRGVCIRNRTGRITTDGTTAVTGANTKFKANAMDSGDWRLYRASDWAYVGKVSAVSDDLKLTLTAVSAITAENFEYVALKTDGSYSLDLSADTRKPGFLNAVYAQRQWFVSGSTARYSHPVDPEAMDLDPVAGDFIQITSARVGGSDTDAIAVVPTSNALLVMKENETFGIFGADEAQFAVRKLADDGALSAMSIVPYDGGVIWAGRDGIYTYNGSIPGVSPQNFVEDRLGQFYKQLVRTFDPSTHRMWSMLVRDHYFLFIENVASPYTLRKGATGSTPTRMTISIYLPTRAVSFATNLDIRGAIEMPASSGKEAWFVANSSTNGYICSATDLFDTTGNDTITCDGNTAGPDFYMESKRYSLGDSLLKKLFKQLLLHYYCGGDDLKFDTIVGLNELGVASVSRWLKSLLSWDTLATTANTWDALSTLFTTWDDLALPRFQVKRIKFLKRSQHFGFRIYQASTAVNVARLGPWSIGFKPQRVGRM